VDDRKRRAGVSASPVAIAAAGLGLLTAILAVIALWEITPFFGGWPGPPPLPLAGYYEAITAQALQSGAHGGAQDQRIRKAEAATWAELRLSPMATDAWLRLAYIHTLKGPTLDAQGVEALSTSFLIAPLDPVICGDRDILALNAWPDLPPTLRQRVLTEIRTLWRPPVVSHPETLAQWRAEVRNPAGQLALLLTLGAAPQP